MKKNILLLVLALGLYSLAFAQQGRITGSVRTSDGQAAEFVNVALKGTAKGAVTNASGQFEIKNVNPGEYVIFASLVGLAKQERSIVLGEGEVLNLDFVLQESATRLAEITVSENRVNSFYPNSAFVVAKMPLKNLENPQVYQSVPQRLLKEQVVTNMNDGLKNATGITRLWESTGRGGDGAEYFSMRGFAVQPTMVNGMPSLNNGGLDPANIESIDVIKGPSGTLFGSPMISYGGLINITTKRPYDTFGGEVNFVNGSNGLTRLALDVNTPLSEKVSSRVNTAYHTENSFQSAGYMKSFFVAPSFKIEANERLTFLVNTEMLFKESANAPMIFLNRSAPLTYSNLSLFEKHYEESFTGNDLNIKNPTLGFQAQALFKISEGWSSQTVIASSNAKSNGYYQYLWDFSDGETFGRYLSKRDGETITRNFQQNFTNDWKIGSFRNRLLIGFDYFESTIKNSSTGWVLNGAVNVRTGEDTGILTKAGADALLTESFEGTSRGENEVMSAYVSDVISFNSYLSAMGSVRIDRFSGKTDYWVADDIKEQVSVSPKLGLVFQPLPEKLALFANYQNGFVNVAPAQVANADGSNPRLQTFDPEQANQIEGGAKAEFWQNRLSVSASYYRILVRNRLMNDPNNVNNRIQGGEVESKGYEISVTANPVKGLNLIAGFSDNTSAVTKDNPENGYLGLRPEEAGPEQLVNAWLSYTLPTTALKGLGLGFGGNYASEHKTLNRANTGTFTLPAYTVLNASLSYTGNQYAVILKVNNLSNERYYSGWSTITPQNLRNVSISLNYAF
ncbi:TonB-dependent receptor [Cytophagales bacterium LB-30]|uniref:TonB-dependent receptor n=1 Tax=Shiella aurantiaca TaxID=3058365 RepID=A0ABT8F9X9_9BACT|nr:TonB-dependent receptor [Shiella aurantiaca]MDN4167006.1 TonB-dependent receptor [Shiella aurantiaca]